jgi:hypothetical protein
LRGRIRHGSALVEVATVDHGRACVQGPLRTAAPFGDKPLNCPVSQDALHLQHACRVEKVHFGGSAKGR